MTDRTIFISGISYTSTEKAIRDLFTTCGEIEKLNLPRYQDTNRLKGYCHITFISQKSVNLAKKLNKTNLDNRYLTIDSARGEREKKMTDSEVLKKKINKKTTTIFVKNLSYDLKEDELGDFFSNCGKIKNVRFVYNSKYGHFKGFAYIEFEKSSSLFAAIKKNGILFKNRKLLIDIDESKAKAGFRLNLNEEGNSKYNKDVLDVKYKKIRKDKKKERFGKDRIKNLTRKKVDSTKDFVKKVDNLNIF